MVTSNTERDKRHRRIVLRCTFGVRKLLAPLGLLSGETNCGARRRDHCVGLLKFLRL